MKKNRLSEAQIVGVLQQAEGGLEIALLRQMAGSIGSLLGWATNGRFCQGQKPSSFVWVRLSEGLFRSSYA